MTIRFFPRAAFAALPPGRLELMAAMCRTNVLAVVKRAGSGHLGSSLSALDIMVWLYAKVMNTARLSPGDPDRDVFFSSKGHDAPGFYAVLHALGLADEEPFLNLRRLGGLEGHPVAGRPGVEAGTGSLGMGLSKAAGMAEAKRLSGRGGRVFVMTGDGELQEGQNYEAMRRAAQRGLGDLVVVVDHNKVQSDRSVEDTAALGDIGAKFQAFGWAVARCDGHDPSALDRALARLQAEPGKPKALIADTVKGRGVSFMEHPAALERDGGLYRWHSGAPPDEAFLAAQEELLARVRDLCAGAGLPAPGWVEFPRTAAPQPAGTPERVTAAFGRTLAALGERRKDLVVLDGDLAGDCGLREFEGRFPERFFEMGVAEQDMVSAAGGMALQGLVPVVNSFAAFLASRANEQIYANACEGTKVVYACHYGGLLPAAAGMSHQSLRDVSLLGAIPGLVAVEPSDEAETEALLRYLVEEAAGPSAIRLFLGPSPGRLPFPEDRRLEPGRGTVLVPPGQALLVAYGPVMLHQAVLAVRLLGGRAGVAAMPWLNLVDGDWLAEVAAGAERVIVVDDHSPFGGLGATVREAMDRTGLLRTRPLHVFGVEGFPACGQAEEVLQAHGLDAPSLARRVAEILDAGRS